MNDGEVKGLIERYRAGRDQDAFSCLFNLFAKRIWGLILSHAIRPPEAENLLQETGAAVALVLEREMPEHFMAMVFQIAKNKIADYFRKPKRPLEPLDEGDGKRVDPPDPRDDARRWEQMRTATQILDRSGLSPEQHECLLLHYYLGYSIKEIGALLEISPDTVKSRIYLGKNKIRAYLALNETPN